MRKGRPDVLVVGAGVFGLACAWACLQRGLSVAVAEAGPAPGAGASGGLVGALAPFAPDRWDARKAFQLRALLGAEREWRAIAAAGGVDPCYARCGRLIPLADDAARARAEALARAARAHWGGAGEWRLLGPQAAPGWLAPDAAACGAVLETLSARLDPRAAVAALAAAVVARGGEIGCGMRAAEVAADGVRCAGGFLPAGLVVVAAGAGSAGLVPEAPVAGVKGQAALLAAAAPGGAPLIAEAGLYVVPQGPGRVAVGSTSEAQWADAVGTDAALDAVIARARAICPALAAAPVVARWAGLRPRARRPDPMLGPLPDRPGVLMATGGFRTGFGLALAAGAAVAAMAAGEAVDLPRGYRVSDHLAGAREM